MQPESIRDDDDNITSLAVVLPLAVAGFVVAAGCWTLFAVAGVHLRDSLELSGLQFGLLLAMPMAVGALLAVPAGVAAQKCGSRRVMIACLAGLAGAMLVLLMVDSFGGYLLAAGTLGLAGGFYSAGLQFVTRHAPAHRTGLVLGLFGAGATGAGFSYYLVPVIQQAFSWQAVPLAYLIMLGLVLGLLVALTDDDDSALEPEMETSARALLGRLRRFRLWRLCLYFGVVAGGFFSLALWLPDFFAAQYALTLEGGAGLARWFVIPGALAQIAGGGLSDRFGTHHVIHGSLLACLAMLFVLSYPPMTMYIRGVEETLRVEFALPLVVARLLVVVLGIALGSAMGGLQKMMVVENPGATGFSAGMLLLSACSVAFLLPVIFGAVNEWLVVRTAVFMILFGMLAGCLLLFSRDLRRRERQALVHREP